MLGEEFEQFIGYFHKVLSFGFSLLKNRRDPWVHSVHELANSLDFETRGDLKKFLPMSRMFDLLFLIKASRMKGHPFAFDPDLHMDEIRQEFTGGTGEGRGDQVAICVKLDKPGFTDRSEDRLVG